MSKRICYAFAVTEPTDVSTVGETVACFSTSEGFGFKIIYRIVILSGGR